MTDNENELLFRIDRLERAARRSRITVAVTLAASFIIALSGNAPRLHASGLEPRYQVLDSIRVRALIVVDSAGRERARVAAPVPDALVLGKRVARGGGVSGFIISDAEGNERGGYVTSDAYPNAFFTLDDMAAQSVLFIAEPQGATTLRIWKGGNMVTASVDESGPMLRVDKNRSVIFRTPSDTAK